MALDLNAQFKHAVEALATVDEPWIALSVLAQTDLRAASLSRKSSKEKSVEPFLFAKERLGAVETGAHLAGVISKNETLEDVSTSSIKFLLIPYLFARLHCAYQGEQSERLLNLKQGRRYLIQYFEAMDNLGLLSSEDSERYLDNSIEVKLTPQQAREQKINRFKAEKAATQKLEQIVQRRITHGSAAEELDEEHLREAALTVIQSSIRKGLDEIASIDQEISILEFATRERAKGRDPRVKGDAARRAAPATVIEGMPPTFKIVSRKEEIRQGVFRPTHTLPTYTVEEWGEIELANAKKKEKERADAEIVRARQTAEEDSDAEADKETMEKRSWDDWRDEHNKGSGNTMR